MLSREVDRMSQKFSEFEKNGGKHGSAPSHIKFSETFSVMIPIACLCFSPEYDAAFFKRFDIVMNALDNRGEYCHECLR